MLRPPPLSLLPFAFTLACTRPDPAPEDLESLLRFTFSHYPDEGANEQSLAGAAANLRAFIDSTIEDPSEPWDAELEQRLADLELGTLDPPPEFQDGAAALGVFSLQRTTCSLDEWQDIYLTDDQASLFPGAYASYERSNQSDFECFEDGRCPEATWHANIGKDLDLLGVHYDFEVRSGIRRIDALPPVGEERVEAMFSRTWMLRPATLSNDDLGDFRQNYQLEILLPDGDGGLHLFALWTDLHSETLNTESSLFVDGYIDGLHDTFEDLTVLCEGGELVDDGCSQGGTKLGWMGALWITTLVVTRRRRLTLRGSVPRR